MRLNYFTFKREAIHCNFCNWEGKGSELKYGDFDETDFICDMTCPSCQETLGYWQAPLIEEAEKWHVMNPGLKTGWENE